MAKRYLILFITIELAFLIAGIWWVPRVLGLYYQMSGARYLDQALKNTSNDLPAMFTCTAVSSDDESARSRANRAADNLNNALYYYPQASHTDLLLGRAHCLLGQPEEAIRYYQVYTWLRPKNPLGHLELGFAYEALSLKSSSESIRSGFIQEWRVAGITADDFSRLGDQMVDQGKYQDALHWYKRAEEMGMNVDGSIGYTSHLFYEEANDLPKAHEALQQAVFSDRGWSSQPVQFLAWYHWGKLLLEEVNYPEAKAAFQKAISIYPGNPYLKPSLSEAYRLLGGAQWGEGNLDEALESLRKAVEIDQNNIWGHIHYGKVVYLQNPSKADQAHQEFLIALTLRPDDLDIWLNLIEFWKWVGKEDKASLYCQQALIIWKDDPHLMARCNQ